jgi:2-hydroxychromene-2-carboxylate isomerase
VGSSPTSFYFDLASPEAYLAAERLTQLLPGAVEWEPVLARELPGSTASSSRAHAHPLEQQAHLRARVEARARELRLQPLRWPDPFPFDGALAMRVATYAKSIGRVVAFSQAAFRQAFAGGRNLQEQDNVLIAAAACEMHPAAVLAAARTRGVARALADATRRAERAGVAEVPTVLVGGRAFTGEHAVEDAAVHTDRGAEALGLG